jgi:hypothetical protein
VLVLLGATLGAALGAAGVSAKNLPGLTYRDAAKGYEITIPAAWKLIPRSKAAVQAQIAVLKKGKSASNHELADIYSSIIASPTGLKGLSIYRFQALAWPPDLATPLLTEVSLAIVKTSSAYTKPADLTALGDEYANALSANAGSKIYDPKTVTLPAGKAELVEGTIPAGGGLATGVELYLIPHAKHVYELSFQIDARGLAQATLFSAIAKDFAFV